jgi:hypothetical protein
MGARFRSLGTPCCVCGGENGTATGFFPEDFGFRLSLSFRQCSQLSFIHLPQVVYKSVSQTQVLKILLLTIFCM